MYLFSSLYFGKLVNSDGVEIYSRMKHNFIIILTLKNIFVNFSEKEARKQTIYIFLKFFKSRGGTIKN